MGILKTQFDDLENKYRNDSQRLSFEILIMACDRMFNQHLSVGQLNDRPNQQERSQQHAGSQSTTTSTDHQLNSSTNATINSLVPEQQTSSVSDSTKFSKQLTDVKSVGLEQVLDDQSMCLSNSRVQHQLFDDQHLHDVGQEERVVNASTNEQLKAYTINEIASIVGTKLLQTLRDCNCWDAYHKLEKLKPIKYEIEEETEARDNDNRDTSPNDNASVI